MPAGRNPTISNDRRAKYIPALEFDWLNPLYDPLARFTTRESTFKQRLVQQAAIKKGHRVLDLGCGTATLTLLIKKTCPEAEVFGLDGDPKILKIAKAKIDGAGADVTLNCGLAFNLPYANELLDSVLSSLVFHHLTRENKRRTLVEVMRVLRPGCELHVADWGKAQNWLMRVASLPMQLLDGAKTTADNVNGLLPNLFREAGFEQIEETTRYMTIFGTLSLYRARKPVCWRPGS